MVTSFVGVLRCVSFAQTSLVVATFDKITIFSSRRKPYNSMNVYRTPLSRSLARGIIYLGITLQTPQVACSACLTCGSVCCSAQATPNTWLATRNPSLLSLGWSARCGYRICYRICTTSNKHATISGFVLSKENLAHSPASIMALFDGDHDKVERLDELMTKLSGFEDAYPITGQTYSRESI